MGACEVLVCVGYGRVVLLYTVIFGLVGVAYAAPYGLGWCWLAYVTGMC